MRKLRDIIICISVLLSMLSCGSSKTNYDGSLVAIPGVINFSGEENRFEEKRVAVSITGNDRDYKVASDDEWIDMRIDGSYLSIGVSRNESGKERSGSVRVVSHLKKPVEIIVNQKALEVDFHNFTGSYDVSAEIKWPNYDDPVIVEWVSDIKAADEDEKIYEINGFGTEGFSLFAKYDNGLLLVELGNKIEFGNYDDCRIMSGILHKDYYVIDNSGFTGRYDADRDVIWFPSFEQDTFIGIIDIKTERNRTALYSNIVMKRR